MRLMVVKFERMVESFEEEENRDGGGGILEGGEGGVGVERGVVGEW